MRVASRAVAVLSTSLAPVSSIPAPDQLFKRTQCNTNGASTIANIQAAMADVVPGSIYGFTPPNSASYFQNCTRSSNNSPGQFCCQASNVGEHDCAIALVMNNIGGYCASEVTPGPYFSGQTVLDGVNSLISTCSAPGSFAGVYDLSSCITLRVGDTGC